MQLIIGGAFQGKLDYAKKTFGLDNKDIFACTRDAIPDFSRRCITDFENYVYYCIEKGIAPQTDFSDDKIIIMNDIFCGVVPAEPKTRAWREEAGRTLVSLAAKASRVTRLFCGLPQHIK